MATPAVKTPTAALGTDLRRITEEDADYQRLHTTTTARLTHSLQQYIREEQRGDQGADSRFINRHIKLMQQAYEAAHHEGQKDYWPAVSNRTVRHRFVQPTDATTQKRLTYYALGSVMKLAHQVKSYVQSSQNGASASTARLAGILDGAIQLDDLPGDYGNRVALQANITWSGFQDGYSSAGASDAATPYTEVWWQLGFVKTQHCSDCPMLAMNSPYDPPWATAGSNQLSQTPGDGQTECGAACNCSLSYDMPTDAEFRDVYAQGIVDTWNAFYAGTDDALLQDLPQTMPLLQHGQPATPVQRGAMDDFRNAWDAWEGVREDLPPAPTMFGTNWNGPDLPPVDDLTPEQHEVIERMRNSLWTWLEASGEDHAQQTSEPELPTIMLYNPNHDARGRFTYGSNTQATHVARGQGRTRRAEGGRRVRNTPQQSAAQHAGRSPQEAERLRLLAQARSQQATIEARMNAAHATHMAATTDVSAAQQRLNEERNRLSVVRQDLRAQAQDQIIQSRATRAPVTYQKYTQAKAEYQQLESQRAAMQQQLDYYGSHGPHAVQTEIQNEVMRQSDYANNHNYRAYQRALAASPRAAEYQRAADQIKAYEALSNKTYDAQFRMNRAQDQLIGSRLQTSDLITSHPSYLAQEAVVMDAQRAYDAATARADAAAAAYHTASAQYDAVTQRVSDLARFNVSGVNYSNTDSQAAVGRVFGRDVSPAELKAAFGAQPQDLLAIGGAHPSSQYFTVQMTSADGQRTGGMAVSRRGNEITVSVGEVRNAGNAAGVADTLVGSMDNMKALGITKVTATAARASGGRSGHGYNGYYTWARLGFTGGIPHSVLGRAQAEFGSHITRVEQLMQLGTRGQRWWKVNGDSFSATFDFHDGSYSMRTLNAWRGMINRNK